MVRLSKGTVVRVINEVSDDGNIYDIFARTEIQNYSDDSADFSSVNMALALCGIDAVTVTHNA